MSAWVTILIPQAQAKREGRTQQRGVLRAMPALSVITLASGSTPTPPRIARTPSTAGAMHIQVHVWLSGAGEATSTHAPFWMHGRGAVEVSRSAHCGIKLSGFGKKKTQPLGFFAPGGALNKKARWN